jgi:uncharacterized membrane protein
VKFAPLIVTLVPTGPLAGEKLVIVGGDTTVNELALTAVPEDVPCPGASGYVVTRSVPDVAPCGTVVWIDVSEDTVKLALLPLNQRPRQGPALTAASQRIRAFDWLRGLAVLVMIQTHSLVLLRPELRAGSFYAGLQWIDGLVAPSFIFAAGFALALTQVRAALASNAPEARRKRFLRTVRRLGEVLFMATLVNWAWFPIFREPHWLIRIDILHCVGLSLLIALPILALLAPHPRALRWSSLLLAALAFGLAPLFEQMPPPWGNFVSFRTGSVFPLLPWGGYVYLGAAVGAACAADGFRATVKWLVALAAVGIALWIATPQISALYPPHEFWVTDPTNHARRWTQVCLISARSVRDRS